MFTPLKKLSHKVTKVILLEDYFKDPSGNSLFNDKGYPMIITILMK